jgi:prepilin signal peptidase PulO-like enzyme (type II secretory pathway)
VSQPNFLTPWEQATGVAEAASPGLAPTRWGWRLTWALTLLFALLLWGQWGLGGILLAWVLARLLVLDLTTYTLPNIYTIPLLCVGLLVALGSHLLLTLVVWAALALVGLGGRTWPQEGLGIGEGDLKLLAAMLAWLGPLPFLGAVAMGCLLWLPGAFAAPKQALPLGVPLLLGWVVVLAFPYLPNALFSPIAF